MDSAYADVPTEKMVAALRGLRRQDRPIARRAIGLTAEALLSEAQDDAPVKTGALKGSHTVVEEDDEGVVIGVTVDYGLPVHQTHPTKERWFIGAIAANFSRVLEGAVRLALRERGAR